jgi:hypothetical protein
MPECAWAKHRVLVVSVLTNMRRPSATRICRIEPARHMVARSRAIRRLRVELLARATPWYFGCSAWEVRLSESGRFVAAQPCTLAQISRPSHQGCYEPPGLQFNLTHYCVLLGGLGRGRGPRAHVGELARGAEPREVIVAGQALRHFIHTGDHRGGR